MPKIIISEEIKKIIKEKVSSRLILEDIGNETDYKVVIDKLKKYAIAGLLTLATLNQISINLGLNKDQVNDIKKVMNDAKSIPEKKSMWVKVTDKAIGTVYNAVPSQCKKDCRTTANNFRLNLKNPQSHRIVAIERTMEKKWGIKQGDVIKVEGAGDLDGIWQVQDRMNKRFAGQPKIDFLVNNNRKLGKWDNLTIYKLRNPDDKSKFLKKFAPQLPLKNKPKKSV